MLRENLRELFKEETKFMKYFQIMALYYIGYYDFLPIGVTKHKNVVPVGVNAATLATLHQQRRDSSRKEEKKNKQERWRGKCQIKFLTIVRVEMVN